MIYNGKFSNYGNYWQRMLLYDWLLLAAIMEHSLIKMNVIDNHYYQFVCFVYNVKQLLCYQHCCVITFVVCKMSEGQLCQWWLNELCSASCCGSTAIYYIHIIPCGFIECVVIAEVIPPLP